MTDVMEVKKEAQVRKLDVWKKKKKLLSSQCDEGSEALVEHGQGWESVEGKRRKTSQEACFQR